MQLLLDASKRAGEEQARALLDVVPLVMRVIRHHMRRHRSGLTVPQFRSLCFVSTAAGTSLSAVADFIGLSLPAMSRLVDGLVEKGLMERRPSDDDRRVIRLTVTPSGEEALRGAREMAQAALAEALASLDEEKRAAIHQAMELLREVFGNEPGQGNQD